jgi:2-methylcitrate dehydratase PrpD
MTLSRQIVRRWNALRLIAPPDAALAAGRLHMLDAVGVGVAAGALAQGGPYRAFAGADRGSVSLLSGGNLHEPADAALVNGGLIHSLEYDDTHTASIVHGSAVLAPTALAVAQAVGVSPEAAVRAYLSGYEILIRMGVAASGAFQANGFQVTSVAGALVAALVATDLMCADEDQRVHAVGIALSQASGVFEFLTNGSSVKSMHPGWAAHSGILAARLAMAGLTGPETAIEGARGLFASFARDPAAAARFEASLEDLGDAWHMKDVAFKFVPCCHYLHPFVEAAASLSSRIGDVGRISEIILHIAERAAPIVCEPWALKLDPPDGHAARWSLPVVVAMQLATGAVDLDSFARKASPEILALARLCRWEKLEPHRFPEAFEAKMTCRLSDGSTVSVMIDDVFGNASRPASEADVLAKFRSNAGRRLIPAAVAALEAFFLQGDAVDFAPYAEALGRDAQSGSAA